MTRVLIIDDAAKEKIKAAINYANLHHYKPWRGDLCPGDNPNYITQIDTFCIVFTFTHSDGLIFRDISISVPGGKLPNPIAVFMIAHHFEFTGWNEDDPMKPAKNWIMDVNDHFIRICQPMKIDGKLNS